MASPQEAGATPAGSLADSAAAAAAARQPLAPPASDPAAREEERRFQEARKKMIKVVNWQLNDDKHRKLEQILDTTGYLARICGNVHGAPEEAKFRKIRITNPTFSRHVREAPGGEEFMHAAGWTIKVDEYEKYFVFTATPGSLEWRVLGDACAELTKLSALVEGKIKRGLGDKRAEADRLRQQVKSAIEEDKAQREVMFQPLSAAVEAQPLPASPRSRQAAARAQWAQAGAAHHHGAAGPAGMGGGGGEEEEEEEEEEED